jgi:hypothetical protein
MIKLFLIHVIREDGNVWLECVDQCGYSDLVYLEFEGPKEWIGKFFYPSNIKFDGLDYDNTESVTIVGNNKKW